MAATNPATRSAISAGAVYNAIGKWILDFPITPDKVPGILIEATWDDTGEIDRVYSLAAMTRSDAINDAREKATAIAVSAGARPGGTARRPRKPGSRPRRSPRPCR